VEYISWYDAVNYCNRRSEQEGLLSAYIINKTRSDPNNGNEFDSNKWLVTWDLKANGYRLPTEAEWEYACRAGTKTSFNTGNNITVAQANYNGSGGKTDPLGKTTPVGSFPPNPWGLYDMHGNVWEWCWDWYRNYSLGVNQADPMGATFGTQRILRGGSWNKKIQHIRSAYRIGSTPSLRSGDFGFRVARSSLGGDLQ
jgi:formylglycine-generating enzyme required for sulfatase activity